MPTNERFWDDIADKYSRKPLSNPESTARKLDVIRSYLRPEHVFVDLGCGTGTIAIELAPSVAVMHGVDISGEMIRIARDKAQKQGADNVEFHHRPAGDGLAGFERGTLDVVSAFNILHLVPDWQQLLASIHDALKPGGLFVQSTPCLADSLIPFRPIIAVMRWIGKAPEVTLLRAKDLRRAMEEAGFQDFEKPDVGASKTTAFIVARRG